MERVLLIVIGFTFLYCLVQALRDFRRGDRLMAAFGLACALALLVVPLPPGRAQLIEFPPRSTSR